MYDKHFSLFMSFRRQGVYFEGSSRPALVRIPSSFLESATLLCGVDLWGLQISDQPNSYRVRCVQLHQLYLALVSVLGLRIVLLGNFMSVCIRQACTAEAGISSESRDPSTAFLASAARYSPTPNEVLHPGYSTEHKVGELSDASRLTDRC
jgi:hypothetical protein